MILNKGEYLEQVFSLDLSYETEKMITARRDFLAGNAQGTSNNTLAHRQELYWQLQEFRYEFWSLSAKQRADRIEELSKQAPPEYLISLEHLQQVSALEEEVKKLEKDLDFDPLFVERFKSRLLWSNNAVPSELVLRTALPTKRYIEFTRIQESVSVLKEKYSQLAHIVPQWLEMIETSEVILEATPEEAAPVQDQNIEKAKEPFLFDSSHQQTLKEHVLGQNEKNRKSAEEKISLKRKEAEERTGAAVLLVLLGIVLLLLMLFG